jgi:hypothetical protein
VNRLRIALAVFALLAVTVTAAVVVDKSSAPARYPTVDQQFSEWVGKHPGYSCSAPKHSSKYMAFSTCTKGTNGATTTLATGVFFEPSAPPELRAALAGGGAP